MQRVYHNRRTEMKSAKLEELSESREKRAIAIATNSSRNKRNIIHPTLIKAHSLNMYLHIFLFKLNNMLLICSVDNVVFWDFFLFTNCEKCCMELFDLVLSFGRCASNEKQFK